MIGCVLSYLLCVGVSGQERNEEFKLETLRGRVVFLAEAVERRHGVPVVSEAKERILALQNARGELTPLLEDVRARAFRVDERLRQMEVELLVRRYRDSPVVQVIRVFEVTKEGKLEIDYWCEVCSIAMFEQKDCECCQELNVLRRRKVEP